MLAPVVEAMTLTLPSGLQYVVESSREAVLSDPADPFSMQTLIETTSLNGRVYTLAYDVASQTYTDTSPEGRTMLSAIDAQGRPVSVQLGDLLPVLYSYDVSAAAWRPSPRAMWMMCAA